MTGMKSGKANMSTEKYKEIIGLPHHISKSRKPLGKDSYAAQFSPFAALTGYDGIVSESERATVEKTELDEDEKRRISDRLAVIAAHIGDRPAVTVTYFVTDQSKAGGEYVTVKGTVGKFDEFEKILYLTDGSKIRVDDLYDIGGDVITAYLPDEP